MTRDYVVQTHPCFEAIAKGNLEAAGFEEVYLPTVIEEVRFGPRQERRSTVMVPLFPGYVFVPLDLGEQGWRRIAKVRGVKRLLGRDSEHPTPLPIGALDDLRGRFLAGEFVKRSQTFQLSAGDQVTVVQGAFEGLRGVCMVSRGDRVRVLLSLLGGTVPVNMTTQMVRKAS